MRYHCVTWLTLRPRGAVWRSYQSDIHILPSTFSIVSAHRLSRLFPRGQISGLIRLTTLSPTFPCFTRSVTTCVLRIATGGWSDLTGRDFHPLNTAPLAGRTSSRLAPYEASPSTEPGVRLSRAGLLTKLNHQQLSVYTDKILGIAKGCSFII